jgi:cell division protein FtsA
MTSRGFVASGKGDRPVDRDDVERAMDAAQAVTLPHNRRIIHSIPREYIIDGQDGIRNPLGLMGYRLEVEAHIVTGAVTSIQNLVQCVERNGIQVIDLVLQPLASAEAVLSVEEKNMGVVLIDMGAAPPIPPSLSRAACGTPWSLPVGGNHITTDIAIGLRTPFVTAEDIKIRYAHTNPFVIDEAETIDVTTFGDEAPHSVSRRELCQIVAMRTEEMFDLIAREIRRSGFESLLPAGMVLTGGTADLRGIRDLASQRLQAPVRIGYPRRVKGLMEAISSPAFSTAVGLLLWGMKAQQAAEEAGPRPTIDGTWFQRLIEWLRIFLPRR